MLYHFKWRWYFIKVGFIGPGKVGVNLGRYFTQKGINLSGYYGRSIENTKYASKITKSKFYENIQEIIYDTDILFITTSDDNISIIDRELSQFDLRNKSICHASGSLKSTVLSNAKLSGALIYSVHPMYAFSSKNIDLKELNTIYFSVEGSATNNTSDIIKLISNIGNKYFIRKKEDSEKYHLANVIVSNLVLSLLEIGTTYLKEIGLSNKEALEAISPLVTGNIENITRTGFVNSLTGPLLRGDLNTIKNHLSVLKDRDLNLYEDLSLNLLNLVAIKNSNKNKNKNDNAYLNNENKSKVLFELLDSSNKHKEIFKILGGIYR